jgi:hypothetical protein
MSAKAVSTKAMPAKAMPAKAVSAKAVSAKAVSAIDLHERFPFLTSRLCRRNPAGREPCYIKKDAMQPL